MTSASSRSPRRPIRAVTFVAAAALTLAGAGCGSAGADGPTPTGDSAVSAGAASAARATAVSGTITVFAAASLREAFGRLGSQFEAKHPGTKVAFSFGPSSGLATQITNGAPADVFASASAETMSRVVSAGAAATPATFAGNVLQVAVPPDNPAGVQRLSDLAGRDVKVAVCQPSVPCGSVAAQVLANAGLAVTPVTREVDVKAVLAKVVLGEVDAGLVYATDVQGAGGEVKGIDIPADLNASTQYPIATLTDAPNRAAAEAFTRYVLSAEAATVLADAGFTAMTTGQGSSP